MKYLFMFLTACGGSAENQWTPKDTINATDLANASEALEAVCARDGGPCNPAFVRSVESGEYCAAGSMLYRHNQPVPEAGISCKR